MSVVRLPRFLGGGHMKAPIKINIGPTIEKVPDNVTASGIRDWQIEALKLGIETTPSASQRQRFMLALIAMGETP
jgi:hypothetical protein